MAYALGTGPDDDSDASAREVSNISETAAEPEDGLALRFATSRGSTVAAAENEPLDNIAIALLRAQASWLRGGDKRLLRRGLVEVLAALES